MFVLNMAKTIATGLIYKAVDYMQPQPQSSYSDRRYTQENGYRSLVDTYTFWEEHQQLQLIKVGERIKYTFPSNPERGPVNGVVRYVGFPQPYEKVMAGVDFDRKSEASIGRDGFLAGVRIFTCVPGFGGLIRVKEILEQKQRYDASARARAEETLEIPNESAPQVRVGRLSGFQRYYQDSEGQLVLVFEGSRKDYRTELVTEDIDGFKFNDQVIPRADMERKDFSNPGVIKFIGWIRGQEKRIRVCVEFNEIRVPFSEHDDANYYFGCKPRHGRLYSPEELVRYNPDSENKDIEYESRKYENVEINRGQITSRCRNYAFPGQEPPSQKSRDDSFRIGCRVQFWTYPSNMVVGGVVRWIGDVRGTQQAGIEFEKPIGDFTVWNDAQEFFDCKPYFGIVRPIAFLESNSRLRILGLGIGSQNPSPVSIEGKVGQTDVCLKKGFDWFAKAEFIVPPIDLEEFINYKGEKGIQWKSNSCYLDSTLISLFAFTNVFDSHLLMENRNFRSTSLAYDDELAAKVRNLLGNFIVNPLRTNHFCPSEPISKLRELLVPMNPKIKSSYMDVEEFMFLLFEQVLNLKGFFTYNETHDSDFIHQIDATDSKKIHYVMTTQRLLEISLNTLKMKFENMPYPALILQMPRSDGKLVGGLQYIIPVLTLDMTNLIEGDHMFTTGENMCCICDEYAAFECQECFNWSGLGVKSCYYCSDCKIKSHHHPSRSGHKESITLRKIVSGKQEMELLAVICVRAKHFVTFVRTSDGSWVFFDSNPCGDFPITEVLPKFDQWLKRLTLMTEAEILVGLTKRKSNAHLNRLLADSHICIYSPTVRETVV